MKTEETHCCDVKCTAEKIQSRRALLWLRYKMGDVDMGQKV